MTSLSNRVIEVKNRKTSVRLAPAEWDAIDEICKQEKLDRKKLFEMIELNKNKNLGFTSAIRVFTIIYYRKSSLSKKHASDNKNIYSPVFDAMHGIL